MIKNCSYCGKEFASDFKICPYCQTDDSQETVFDDQIEPTESVNDSDVTMDQVVNDSDVTMDQPVDLSVFVSEDSEDELIGKYFGGAVIKQELGQGGMGSVYLGHHLTLDIPVAVKFLKKEFVKSQPEAVERFLKEARAVAKLKHPNIVSVLNAGFEHGMYYISMEFIDGKNLDELLKTPFPIELGNALLMIGQICGALKYAHDNNIIHRDIKPANIFVDKQGNAMVGDLGLAKDLSEDQSMTHSMQSMGTPYYISPEQATKAKDADRRSDIYSLGCTFYRMFCGDVPYKGKSSFDTVHKHLTAPIPNPQDSNPDLPDLLSMMIRKMMAKEPEERYQGLEEVLKIVEKLKQNPKACPDKDTVDPIDITKTSHLKLIVAGISVIAVIIVILLLKGGDSSAKSASGQTSSVNDKAEVPETGDLKSLNPVQKYLLAKKQTEEGDFIKAVKTYKSYFDEKVEALDPHFGYCVLLKQQEGIEGARAQYAQFKEKSKSPSAHLAYALLLSGDERRKEFKKVEEEYPDFGPLYYFASLEWKAFPQMQTFAEKREELHLLQKFQDLDSKGLFLKYFLLKEKVDEYRVDASQRLKKLTTIQATLKNPVQLKIVPLQNIQKPSVIIGGSNVKINQQFNINIADLMHVKEIFYSLDGKSFKSTGISDNVHPVTGIKMPHVKITIPGSAKNVYVKYLDSKDVENGPYILKVEVENQQIASAKSILKMTEKNWLSYRDYDGKLLVYFTHLATHIKSLKEIRYSFASQRLDKLYKIDPKDPYGNVYMPIPFSTEYMAVQLQFKDHSKTEIVKFYNPFRKIENSKEAEKRKRQLEKEAKNKGRDRKK